MKTIRPDLPYPASQWLRDRISLWAFAFLEKAILWIPCWWLHTLGINSWSIFPLNYFIFSSSEGTTFLHEPTSETDGINCHSLSQRSSSLWAVCSLSWFQCVLCRILFACGQSDRWDSGSCVLSFLSCVWVFMTPWTVAHLSPLSMECSRQEYWSGLPFPSLVCLPDPGIQPRCLC